MKALTLTEARVILTALSGSHVPVAHYEPYMAAVDKLRAVGMACRECPGEGKHTSRLGGSLCDLHKMAEDARYK